MARTGWGRHSVVATGSNDSGKQISVNAWNDDLDTDGILGLNPETVASASSVTPTNSFVKLSGSTSVDTIALANSSDGDLLYVITTGSVTLNNTSSPSSAGDIRLLGNANKDLSTTVPTILIRNGNYWYEYGGSPVTDASITFAKIQDIASMKVIGRTAGSSGVSSEVTILDSDTMSGASDSTLATSESIKAYVDNNVSSVTASSTTTFTNKTIDADGTGNSITNIEDANIKASAAIDATKIANGTVTSAEFQYLGDVTSLIQAQIDGKSPTAGNTSLVTTGALDTGSITSGFGNINIGSSTFTTTGAVATGAITAGGTITGDLTGNVTGNVSGSSGSTTGNAATATALATARTIGGTSFDGTADIAVALSATATALATARTIGGVSFDGTANINLPGVNAAGTQNTSGTAAGLSATLAVASGGTNLTSYTAGDLLYATGSTTLAKLAKGTASQQIRMNTGATAPEWFTPSGGATYGSQQFYVDASACIPIPSSTAGVASSYSQQRMLSNGVAVTAICLPEHASVNPRLQFNWNPPQNWDHTEGIKLKIYWTLQEGSATFSGDSAWACQCSAIGNHETINLAWASGSGDTQKVTDTFSGTEDQLHITSQTGAITLAGTPAEADMLQFRIYREAAEDTLTAGSVVEFLGCVIEYEQDAATSSG